MVNILKWYSTFISFLKQITVLVLSCVQRALIFIILKDGKNMPVCNVYQTILMSENLDILKSYFSIGTTNHIHTHTKNILLLLLPY